MADERRPVAIVTGASYGIGGATAAGLARDGFDVVVTDLDTATLTETVRHIEDASASALALALDIRSDDSIAACLAAVSDAFGGADLLVNNAGVPSPMGPTLDMSRADWARIIDVNLTGTFMMSQAMARHLIAAGRPGHIVSLASTHGLVGVPGSAAYGTAKAGISHLTKVMAIEWARHEIRANAVAPATTMTESRADALRDNQRRANALSRLPLSRFLEAPEVANAIRYLASPGASYISGHTLVIDGGMTVD